VSVHEQPADDRSTPAQLAADFLATLAIFAGLAALVYYPGRLGTGAVFIALLAVVIGDTRRRLVPVALAVTTACWFLGMALAVVLDQPIF
jgi:hypothetical protein